MIFCTSKMKDKGEERLIKSKNVVNVGLKCFNSILALLLDLCANVCKLLFIYLILISQIIFCN